MRKSSRERDQDQHREGDRDGPRESRQRREEREKGKGLRHELKKLRKSMDRLLHCFDPEPVHKTPDMLEQPLSAVPERSLAAVLADVREMELQRAKKASASQSALKSLAEELVDVADWLRRHPATSQLDVAKLAERIVRASPPPPPAAPPAPVAAPALPHASRLAADTSAAELDLDLSLSLLQSPTPRRHRHHDHHSHSHHTRSSHSPAPSTLSALSSPSPLPARRRDGQLADTGSAAAAGAYSPVLPPPPIHHHNNGDRLRQSDREDDLTRRLESLDAAITAKRSAF